MNVLFPPLKLRHKLGGNAASALCGLLLLGLPLGGAQAAETARQQIEQAVEQYLGELLAEEAEHEGWQETRFSHSTTELSSSDRLPACSQPLDVSSPSGAPSLRGRLRLDVSCPEPDWTVPVNSRVNVFVSAVFADELIERGETIKADQLKRQELRITSATRYFYSDPKQVAGKGAKRRIRPNQLVIPRLLTMPVLVRRGEQVDIVASKGGIAATTLGEALEDGQEGEVIRVRNISSDKVIEAQVMETGVVSSIFR